MGSLGKLLAAGSPLIAALLAQVGIAVTEEEVSTWLNFTMWAIALVSFFAPSFRSWLIHRESAK